MGQIQRLRDRATVPIRGGVVAVEDRPRAVPRAFHGKLSDTPARTRFRTADRRMSCITRPASPATSYAAFHALAGFTIGRPALWKTRRQSGNHSLIDA